MFHDPKIHCDDSRRSYGSSDLQSSTCQAASLACDVRVSKLTTGGFLCGFSITHVFPASSMCKKQTAVSHSRALSEIKSLDAGLRMDGLPAPQFGDCVLKTTSSKLAKGNLQRHTRERVIPSHSHSDICVFGSSDDVPPNFINSSHSTQLDLFRRHCGSDPNDQQRTKPKPKARQNNAHNRFGLVCRKSEVGSMLINTCEQTIKWRVDPVANQTTYDQMKSAALLGNVSLAQLQQSSKQCLR